MLEIKQAVKEAEKIVETLKKDLKGHQNYLEKSYKNLDKAKLKYIKYQDELTSSKGSESFHQENHEQCTENDDEGRISSYLRILAKGTSYPEYISIGRVIIAEHARGTGVGHQLMKEAFM